MSLLQVLVLVLAVIDFVSFVWAFNCFFLKTTEHQVGLRTVKIFGGASTSIVLGTLAWPGTVMGFRAIFAALLFVASLVLFGWAINVTGKKPFTLAFSSDAPRQVFTLGPYQWIRHPFYSSYMLAWLGGAIATRRYWLWVPAVLMFIIYYRAAKFEERKFLSGPLTNVYSGYRGRTGMFFPNLRSLMNRR